MDDLDMLARDFGFGPRGKSNPMRSDPVDRSRPAAQSSFDEPLFNDVFGAPSKYSSSLKSNANSNKQSAMNDFDYDTIFKSSEQKSNDNNSKKSSLPVYDKPVYDDDIFDGLPGLKSKPATTTAMFDTDSLGTDKSKNHHTNFDDLLGNLTRNEKVEQTNKSSSAKKTSASQNFDDLLDRFRSSSSATGDRPIPESTWGSVPAAGSKQRPGVADDPFVILESTSAKGSSSSRLFTDPLKETNKSEKSRSASAEVSSGSGKAFDDLDPLNNFGNSLHTYSTEREIGGKDVSPSRPTKSQSGTTRELKGNSSFGNSERNMEKKVPLDHFQEPPLFDVPNASVDFQKSSGQTTSSHIYHETGTEVDMAYSSSGQGQQYDEIWLTVSEIPLFTQPTNAPPPSRPPPPIPRQGTKLETRYFSSSSNKKNGDFFSPPSYTQSSQSPKLTPSAAQGKTVSQFDELEDFAKGFSRYSFDESTNLHSNEEANTFSTAAASAAAMKDAMDKAEAKFRYAKEVREREYAKVAKSKESVQIEREEQDCEDGELRETQERVDHEKKQKEEEEREKRRLEREREIEREKARQAVERATREARERAAAEARERAAAEARLKSERAAVQRAQAEARERAAAEAKERAEKAAAGARERASAAEAKERAERVAAEVRERSAAAEARERSAAAEAREKEAANKAAAAKVESEARRRAERAAFERAAAEARERAAADARERAAAAKANQRKNDNDLDSIFGTGRASSVPRAHENPTDSMFNQQFPNKGASEVTKKMSSGVSSNSKRASSTTNIIDDLSSIFGAAPSSGEFQEVEGETAERQRARSEREQRTQERTAKALAEKNKRDIQAQRDQEERHRISETLDSEIKRWAAGKEGNLRALLSTLQYVLWPECGWQPVSLTDLIMGASVKKVYRKATLCIHPDKVQQKGATLQQKYIAEKVFDLLKEAWNKFNSEELF
ncbi:LOW QUALITY PROTEIN: auxilin-related protein 1-like [Primulina eburnea]|uniref:LOW QUALITY PROTEIN: auxilin-related protein 1-like n=1 Tax=Primulina eburnea TaxID=1245227 RepID=UPI003C6C5663